MADLSLESSLRPDGYRQYVDLFAEVNNLVVVGNSPVTGTNRAGVDGLALCVELDVLQEVGTLGTRQRSPMPAPLWWKVAVKDRAWRVLQTLTDSE